MEPVKREEVSRVSSSMALRMADGNYIALPESIASRGSPIVINNACASWHRLAGNFVFGNARCYLGTLFSVIDSEAQQIVEKLFGKYIDQELAVGLWRAQRDLYGDGVRRPYVLAGCHFQRLRTNQPNALGYVIDELRIAQADWQAELGRLTAANDSAAKSVADMVDFLKAELKTIHSWQTAGAGKTNHPPLNG